MKLIALPLALGMLTASPGIASAADVLNEARVRIAMADPLTCAVTASFVVALAGGNTVEHRLQRLEGSRLELLEVTGATQGVSRSVGITEALTVTLPGAGTHRYELRYRVVQPDAWAFRCPVWLPTVAGDGRSRSIEIEAVLPSDARAAGGSFPAFQWADGIGRATLANLPAFVRLPYVAPGETHSPTRDVSRLMDVTAVGVLIAGTVLWVIRKRR
jgi:hypothetical protein